MNDYLEVFEKFKDVNDIHDYIDEVQKLREYFRTGQRQKMQDHIGTLMVKYLAETIAWNAVHTKGPTSFEQSFFNAECFMQKQGAKLVVEKASDYKSRLSPDEISFIESMIKPME